MEPVYSFTKNSLLVFMKVFFRWRFLGAQNIPARGPAIIACNHISYFDPLCHGHMLMRAKRRMRFFAKSELWRNPFLRFILKNSHMIPVDRGSGELGPVDKAVGVLAEGDVVMIYPEATITTTEDLMPMRGKTGLARVALSTGVPVIPCAVWGSQWVRPKGRIVGRKTGHLILLKAGTPMTFPEYAGMGEDADAVRDVTDRVMKELEILVRELQQVHPRGAAVPRRREVSDG